MYQNTRVQRRTAPTTTSSRPQTNLNKATQKSYQPAKPVGKMLLFGTLSLAVYILLFSNQARITTLFTAGGWHAACPVLTAFLFSFIHGSFASNLLSVIGLEAKKG